LDFCEGILKSSLICGFYIINKEGERERERERERSDAETFLCKILATKNKVQG
jgi:hypothetical protein